MVDKNILKKIIILICSVIFFLLVFVYCHISSFSSLSNDDFIHYNQALQMSNRVISNNFFTAVRYALFDMTHFGGRYFSMFVQYLFGPKPFENFITQEKIIMVVNVLLYYFGLLFLSFSVTDNLILKDRQTIDKILLSFVLLFAYIIPMNIYNYYHDIFTWYSGAVSYILPIAVFCFSLGIFLYEVDNNNNILNIVYVVLSFLSMGGNIGAVVLCFSFIFIYVINLALSKKLSKKIILLVLPYVVGFLINLLSPGNYFRARQNNDRTFSIITLFFRTINYITNRFEVVFVKPFFIAFIFTFSLIIFLFILKYKINFKKYVYSQLFYVIIPFLIASIVALAYNNSLIAKTHFFKEYDCHDRTAFLIDVSLVIVLYHVFIVLITFMHRFVYNLKTSKMLKNIFLTFCLILSLGIVCLPGACNNQSLFRIHMFQLTDNLLKNKYEVYYKKYLECINRLKENSGIKEKLVIKMPLNDIPLYSPFDELGLNQFFNIDNIEFEY